MLTYVLLIVGFAILIKGANLLVEGASSIARILKVSDLVVGLTIVAFGTSTPELFVNIFAGIKANADIAIGNVVGSNIFNILVILGVSSVIFPLIVTRSTVWIEIPLTLAAAVLLGLLANDHLLTKSSFQGLSRTDAAILLGCFAVFVYYVLRLAGKNMKEKGNDTSGSAKQYSPVRSALMIVAGLVGLFVGSKFVVDGAVVLAAALGVSQSLIALTIVAAGTSLPELATSVVAAYKKNCDIAVGNILGSNIFNTFLILGISASIRPIPLQPKSNIDIGVGVLAALILFVAMFSGKKGVLDRWEGLLFVGLYMIYVGFLIAQG
ncbi:MAG TPA: calcium/sodium antiporter [Sedimentisphaerales bacterium]|nr:calcium/sodium antiporter [Sedimentisphaerales bacterium]